MFHTKAAVMKEWTSKARDYHQKLDGLLTSRTVKRFKT